MFRLLWKAVSSPVCARIEGFLLRVRGWRKYVSRPYGFAIHRWSFNYPATWHIIGENYNVGWGIILMLLRARGKAETVVQLSCLRLAPGDTFDAYKRCLLIERGLQILEFEEMRVDGNDTFLLVGRHYLVKIFLCIHVGNSDLVYRLALSCKPQDKHVYTRIFQIMVMSLKLESAPGVRS